ncbi:type IV toxin-antitoxin system AbiEi family antitoxin domain-containing protein, partial [Bifidobacterium longum]|nr:type IV toxin-antitoxin system AbiEi family antitoxin domain-containing protein [Bifidobacterium longum]
LPDLRQTRPQHRHHLTDPPTPNSERPNFSSGNSPSSATSEGVPMSTRATEAESVLKEHMGYLPVSEMERRGVSRTEISRFVREAKLEKAAKGLYVSPNAESDPLFELQYRYPKAIFFA